MAAALAKRGARLILSARKAEALESLAGELPGDGHRSLPADLAEEGAAERLASEAGDVDVLVANAGLPGSGRLDELRPDQVRRALRVNLESPMLLAQALAPAMIGRGAGHMVLVASLSGKAPSPRSSVYNATKFGLRGFALGLRTDLAPLGVGVSLVSPGFIREVGMFADAGAKPPPGLGTSTAKAVADGVVRAIERNLVEVVVAPPQLRMLAHVALTTPRIAVRTAAGGAAQKIAARVAAGQVDKR